MKTVVDGTQTPPLGDARPRDPAEEARAKLELRARLFGRGDDEAAKDDRYRLVRRIGAGGAGQVYEAWDAELGRRVAIKIIHPRSDGDTNESQARARLMREAQAIARLAHPHVVAVFDVGRCTERMARVLGPAAHGGVFVVMEYVDGDTLRAWGRRRPALRQVVRAIAAAGRGLAAAHDQGIVHRDFKPSNVAFGADGRVRVLDFGLARAPGSTNEVSTGGSDLPVLDDLTGPGLVLGTPPYMAPEQHRGETIGPTADQYALCVTLWELCTGERPFRGATSGELLTVKMAGPPPPSRGIPRWLDTVMRRGLAADPGRRYASMNDLVRALDRGLRRRARVAWLTVAGVTLTGAIVLGALGRDLHERRECGDGAVAKVWSDEHASAVRAAFVASGRPTASDTFARMRDRLDDYATELQRLREEACVAGDSSASACLDERLQRLQATVAIAREDDADVVAHALALAMELPPLAPCGAFGQSPSSRANADLARAIARAEALLVAGRLHEANTVVSEATAVAAREGDREAAARLNIVAGAALERRGGTHPEEAEQRYRAALVDAEIAGRDDVALDALTRLVHVVGPVAGRFTEADRLAEQAEAKLERLGRPPEPAAALAIEVGLLRYREHRNDDALAAYGDALTLRRELFGADHPKVARVWVAIGNVLLRKGRFVEAREHFSEALSIAERAFGPDHTAVAGPLNGLALAMQAAGNTEGSLEPLERTLAIASRNAGTRHDDVAVALSNLGIAFGNLGRDADALAAFDEALAIRIELFGEDHVAVSRTRTNRASMLRRLERYDEAEDELRKALAAFEQAMGPDSPAVGTVTLNLADLMVARGQHAASLDLYARAVAILEQRNDVEADGLTKARLGMAQAQLGAGRRMDAVAGIERVLADGTSAELSASARLLLAQAVEPDDPVRASELASRARAWYRDRGDMTQVEAIDAMVSGWGKDR